jgi:HAMP domain-containing protein
LVYTASWNWSVKTEIPAYSISAALSEIAEARKNREAEVGVFVFSAKTAPAGLEPFARYGNDFIIVWDSEDPATDLLLKSTFSVSRCILTRKSEVSQETEKALAEIVEAARSVERQVRYLEDFKKKGDIIKNHGKEIAHRAELMIDDLGDQINRLDRMVEALRADSLQEA